MDAKPSTSDTAARLVLIIDDEPVFLQGVQAWLRDNDRGFAVLSASDGRQGLALIRRHRPDLVVSDIRMPGLSGIELLLACRQEFPDIRFILMSAVADQASREQAMASGACRFLKKPVDLPALEQTISDVLYAQDEDEERADGYLKGISIPGFIQLLHMESQTLTLILERPDGARGQLMFRQGQLIHAETGSRQGEEAALTLLAWDDAAMLVDRSEQTAGIEPTISSPISHLLMEAMRLKDEQSRSA